MRLTFVPTIIATVIALAIAYLAYYITGLRASSDALLAGCMTFLSLLVCLGAMMGLDFDNKRVGANARAGSSIFLIITLAVNFGFAIFGMAIPFYIVLLIIITAVHLLLIWKMSQMHDV